MNCDELQQQAALHALGLLAGDELAALERRLRDDAAASAELARFMDAAAALAATVPLKTPPPAVRARVLEQIRRTPRPPAAAAAAKPSPPPGPLPPFQFVDRDAPWLPTPLPGIRLKVLSASPSADYAMLLAELTAGAVYPEHDHEGVEETYVLSGDLTCQGRVLGPGDYFHAEPGTHHEPLTSRDGCTAIFVVPRRAFLEFVGSA